MEEYRIDVKVKNNIILKKIEQAGYKNLGEFCRLNKITKWNSTLGSIINMVRSPLRSDGQFRECVLFTAELLGCDPIDFFTDTQLNTVLKTNKRSIQVNEAEMRFMLESQPEKKLLENMILDDQKNKAIQEALKYLTDKERQIIEMRLGLGQYDRAYTLSEIGNIIQVTQERVRQIEAKALRKMRHPRIADKLREFVD